MHILQVYIVYLLTRSETGLFLFLRFTEGDRKILRIWMFGRSIALHPVSSNTILSNHNASYQLIYHITERIKLN